MIVLKPIKITDSILDSSTVPEPDTANGEVEWIQNRPNYFAPQFRAIRVTGIGDTLYFTDISANTVFSHSKDGTYLTSFSTAAQTTSPSGITNDGTFLYVSEITTATTATVFKYQTDGTFITSITLTFSASGTDGGASIEYNGGYIYAPSFSIGVYSRVTKFSASSGSLVDEYDIASLLNPNFQEIQGIASVGNSFRLVDSIGQVYDFNLGFTAAEIIANISINGILPFGLFYDGSRYFTCDSSLSPYNINYFSTQWEGVGLYFTGEQAIKTSTHKVYQAATETDDDPEDGVLLTPPTWVEIGATNKYKMFDNVGSSQSTDTTQLIVEITPGEIFNGLASFNISDVDSVNVTVDDPVDGEVYNEDIDLKDNSEVVDWYYYYFSEIQSKTEFLIDNFPAYKDATITVTYDGGSIGVGSLVVGRQLQLGFTEYGTSLGGNDYSRRDVDEFGNITTVRRGMAKTVDFNFYVETPRVGWVYRTLADLRTINCVWYGTGESDDPTLAYGYYTDFVGTISNPSTSSYTLSVESIV